MSAPPRRVTVIVLPDGRPSRTFTIPYPRLKRWAVIAAALLVLWGVSLASWAWLAGQAAQVPVLRHQVRQLERERARVAALAATLAELERRYEQMRAMLGVQAQDSALVLPPPGSRPVEETLDDSAPPTRP